MFNFKKAFVYNDSSYLVKLMDEYLANKNEKTAAALFKYLSKFEINIPMKHEEKNLPDFYFKDNLWIIPIYSSPRENTEVLNMKKVLQMVPEVSKLGTVYMNLDDRIMINEAFIKYMMSVSKR